MKFILINDRAVNVNCIAGFKKFNDTSFVEDDGPNAIVWEIHWVLKAPHNTHELVEESFGSKSERDNRYAAILENIEVI